MEKQSDAFHMIAKLTVVDDRLDEFHKIICNDAIESRKEPGCIRFDVSRDKEDKHIYHVY